MLGHLTDWITNFKRNLNNLVLPAKLYPETNSTKFTDRKKTCSAGIRGKQT